jgi:cytochrome c biogenesis factor
MRAVLDTNFWLATHVVVVTLGYASTFVAGFLALIYILRGMFTKTLGEQTAKALARMVYGIVCFATLFSFVGTVLGGIWADQSWGRFWGWDPKENGALIIVLWNVLILHARWGGMIRERGLIVCGVVGNIVTSWSWFGVNMLGIGLHSYGFTDSAFRWLLMFVVSQLVIIGLGVLPNRYWASFRGIKNPAKPVKSSGSSGGSNTSRIPKPKPA